MGHKILKGVTLIFILFLVYIEGFSQNSFFDVSLGKSYRNFAKQSFEFDSDRFLIVGNARNLPFNQEQQYFIFIDSFGNIVSERYPYLSPNQIGISYLMSADRNLVFINEQFRISKADTGLNVLWVGDTINRGWNVCFGSVPKSNLLSHGENKFVWLTTGINGVFPFEAPAASVFDSTGNFVQSGFFCQAEDLSNTKNGGIIVVKPLNIDSIIVQKFDSLFLLEWESKYPFNSEGGYVDKAIMQRDDGNIIIVLGRVRNFTSNKFSVHLFNYDTSGILIDYDSVEFNNTKSDNINIFSILENGEVIIQVPRYSCQNEIFYFDQNFNLKWSNIIGFKVLDFTLLSRGKILGAGHNTHMQNQFPSETCQITDSRIVLFDNNGNGLTRNKEQDQSWRDTEVFPNPASDKLNFKFSLFKSSLAEIIVFSPQGNVILSSEINGNSPSIDISSLESGIYIYKIQSEEFNSVGKFIKE